MSTDGPRLTADGIDLSGCRTLDLYGDYLADDGTAISDSRPKVAESDDLVILRDFSGHELNELATLLDMDRSELSKRMHNIVRSYGRDEAQGTGDPLVFVK
jgi:hypothetical protein